MACQYCGSDSWTRVHPEGGFVTCDVCGGGCYMPDAAANIRVFAPLPTRPLSFEGNCQQCGKRFSATRRDAKFCCSACRVQFHRDAKKTPAVLLADNPFQLARYNLLKDYSPDAAATVAKHLRNSIPQGLETLAACVAAIVSCSEVGRAEFRDLRMTYQPDLFQAARNG